MLAPTAEGRADGFVRDGVGRADVEARSLGLRERGAAQEGRCEQARAPRWEHALCTYCQGACTRRADSVRQNTKSAECLFSIPPRVTKMQAAQI